MVTARAGAALLLVMLAQAVEAAGGTEAPPNTTRRPWQFEFGIAALREAWDYNLSDEDLVAATCAWLRHVTGPWWFGGQGLIMYVYQERVPNAVVAGGSALVRWQRPYRGLVYFASAGGGYSYAGSLVPERGTRANYIAQSSGGVMVPASPRAMLAFELLWLHLSNNGLAGRDRNPDIQALGMRVDISVPWR